MMRLRLQESKDGLHPSEAIVTVKTKDGVERLVVDKEAVVNNSLDIGYPIRREASGSYLVELPQETTSGSWRIWVPSDTVFST